MNHQKTTSLPALPKLPHAPCLSYLFEITVSPPASTTSNNAAPPPTLPSFNSPFPSLLGMSFPHFPLPLSPSISVCSPHFHLHNFRSATLLLSPAFPPHTLSVTSCLLCSVTSLLHRVFFNTPAARVREYVVLIL